MEFLKNPSHKSILFQIDCNKNEGFEKLHKMNTQEKYNEDSGPGKKSHGYGDTKQLYGMNRIVPINVLLMNLFSKAKNAIKSKVFWKTYSFFIDRTFQPKISYSQNGEDIIVYGIFEALSKKKIFYLDAGGYHPYNNSNTALFYLTGSSGIVIEPNPELYKQFPLKRPRDINLNIGVSVVSGTQPFLLSYSGAQSSLIFNEEKKSSLSDKHEFTPVIIPVQTLTEIIKEHAKGKNIDFLSLDIEGMDLPVLQTLDFLDIFPLVICVETIQKSAHHTIEKRVDIIEFLKSKGYFVYADTYINTIFVRNDIW
jgi:FkbM family methyltransferase